MCASFLFLCSFIVYMWDMVIHMHRCMDSCFSYFIIGVFSLDIKVATTSMLILHIFLSFPFS